jgi:MFS family permease
MNDYLQVLRQRDFAKLWVAQILSVIAQNLLNFALIILIFTLTHGTHLGNIAVSLLVVSFAIPSVLFASVAGEYVDRWDRRKVMATTNALRGGLVLLYILLHTHYSAVLLLSFVISVVMQFFMPAEAATIPKLVPSKSLLAANSLFIFSFYACFIIGYSVSAPVINYFGERGPFYLTAAMFMVAAVLNLFLPAQPAAHPTRNLPRPHIVRQFKINWRLIRDNHRLGFAITQLTITQGLVGVIMALAPALSLALLKIPLQKANWYLVVPVGLGMVAGVASVSHLTKRLTHIRLLERSLVAAGAMLMLFGFTGLLYRTYHGHSILPAATISIVVATVVFLLGMINAIISATAQTLLQENAREDERGKAFGSLNMFINLASTLPILVAGVLADLISVTKVIIIIGAGVVIYALFQLRLLRYRPAQSQV